MKKLLAIIALGLLLSGCSKKPKTAYICYDFVTGIKKFAMIYDYPDRQLWSPNTWVHDKISTHSEYFWNEYRKKPVTHSNINSNIIIRYYESLELDPKFSSYNPLKGEDKGEKFSLPLTDYRNEYFDTEDNTLTVYEYKHPLRVSQNNLEMREDKNGVKIKVYFEKKYKCREDKELFEGLER